MNEHSPSIVPRHVLGRGFVPPSDKVNVAVIGVGGQGFANVRSLFEEPDCQIVAIADPAEEWDMSWSYHGGKAGRGPVRRAVEERYRERTPHHSCAVYEDFRPMLEKERAIDAVLIATPDHLHAYVSIWAMKAGKHVYCEKPLTHGLWEGRQVARVAREAGVATQLGNQGHSGEGHRLAVEWLRDGAIGAVREVHAWVAGTSERRLRGRPAGTPPPPAGFNWDLWLGPRQERPYHPDYTPGRWRDFWDFGGGRLPDFAAHHLDPAFHALELDAARSIEASTPGPVDSERTPSALFATWHFDARGHLPPLRVHWYDGGLLPPTPRGVDPDDPRQRLGDGGHGIVLVGDRGVMTCGGWSGMPRLLPLELHRAYARPPRTIPRVEGHHADWLRACKGGPPASSNFEYGARLCEFGMLPNIALRAGGRLEWDAASMRATNAPLAGRFLQGSYRRGWELPL